MNDGGGTVREVAVPPGLGPIVDVAPVRDSDRPVWLVLGADGSIGRWDTATGDHAVIATTTVPPESDREPWDGHQSRRHLHAAPHGEFAAVVNDYGRFGEVIDLRTGDVTMALDNHGHHDETVPFSLEFTQHSGRCLVVHRTEWNRLDVSDARTGTLLTERLLAKPVAGGGRVEHELDYFHGALYVSPDGKRILDDGWVWHPVGFVSVWSLERWIAGEVWESEDGPSRAEVCGREYYWDHAMTWIDSIRVAVEGLGDDDEDMRPGARILDTTRSAYGDVLVRPTSVELRAIAGPRGPFFSDGTRLFARGDTGLSVWDPTEGTLLDTVDGFVPTHHHRGADQFLRLGAHTVRSWPL